MTSGRAEEEGRVRAVLFDLDGVLVDSYEAWFHVVGATSAAFGFGPVSRARFEGVWGQGISADLENLYPGRTHAEVEGAYEREMAGQAATVHVNPEAAAVLEDLRGRGVLLACVTNTPEGLARAILRASSLAGRLDAVVGMREGLREKPAPDLLRAALRTLGARPAEALMVGDSRYDEAGAAAAGVPFLRYDLRDGASLSEALSPRVA